MKKIPAILLFLLYLPNSMASSTVTELAVSYDAGTVNRSFNCSGSFVRNNSKRYFLSASHCFKNSLPKKIKTYIFNHRNYKKVRSSKVNIDFSQKYYFNRAGDTVFKEIDESVNIKTNELELSTMFPIPGDPISVFGYPISRGKRVATELSCNFLGSTVYQTPFNPIAIGRIIKCKTKLRSLGGLSGGPVLNESGELLGVVSAEIHPASDYQFQGDRFLYLIFNEVTNELLENYQMQRQVNNFIKMSPGKYLFIEANEEDYLKPSMYLLKQ